jgi:hypothetical protein
VLLKHMEEVREEQEAEKQYSRGGTVEQLHSHLFYSSSSPVYFCSISSHTMLLCIAK